MNNLHNIVSYILNSSPMLMALQTRRGTDHDDKYYKVIGRIGLTLFPYALTGIGLYIALHDDIKDIHSDIALVKSTQELRNQFTQQYRDGVSKRFDNIEQKQEKNEQDLINHIHKSNR